MMKLLVHSQTLVQPLKVRIDILTHVLLGMRLFIHAVIKLNPWSYKGHLMTWRRNSSLSLKELSLKITCQNLADMINDRWK